jgi:hypothetical protein
LAAFAESAVVISGGSVLDPLKANDASTVELTGGSVLSFLAASDDAMVMLSGGLIEQFISAAGDATIEIVGSNFSVDGNPVPYGNLAVSTGFLSGTLESGEVVLNAFYQGDALGYYSGTIRLVPEPDSSVVLIAGATLLVLLSRRRARYSHR